MFLIDDIFNGADLLFYIAALGGIYVGYRIAKRREARREQQQRIAEEEQY